MHRLLSLLPLLLAAACGGTPGATEPRRPTPAAVPACPASEALAATLEKLWGVPAGVKMHVTCTPGHFPAPGWAVAAVVDASKEEAYARWAVLTTSDDHTVLAQTGQNPIAPWFRDEGGGGAVFEAVDFDGDGTDELVTGESMSHGGTSYASKTIWGVSAGAIVKLLPVLTHYDNEAADAETGVVTCDARFELSPPDAGGTRTVVATGTIKKQKPEATPDESCIEGKHTWRLEKGKFVEQKP